MRLYVAGPVTGRPNRNLHEFELAAERLVNAGHVPLLPHWFVSEDASWDVAMRCSIETLVKCDGVALLADWSTSKGAQIESRIAIDLEMPVGLVHAWCGGDIKPIMNSVSQNG